MLFSWDLSFFRLRLAVNFLSMNGLQTFAFGWSSWAPNFILKLNPNCLFLVLLFLELALILGALESDAKNLYRVLVGNAASAAIES